VRVTRRITMATVAVMALALGSCSSHEGTATADATSLPGEAEEGGSSATSPGVFGTLEEPVCGPAPGGASPAEGDQGVSADSIAVGVMGDADNVIVPGVNEDLFNASEAFVAWCNEAGGIRGRRIDLTVRDAGLLQARERMSDACAEDFAVVGGGLALDGAAVDTRVACGLVEFPGFVNDVAARETDFQVMAVPSYKDRLDVTRFAQIADAFPDVIDGYGVLISAAVRGSGRGYVAQSADALAPLGYELVYEGEFPGPPAVVDNWRPYVEEMRSAGVKVLDVYSSPEIVAPLQEAMRDVGWHPEVIILPSNNYSPILLEGGDAIENTYVGVYTVPFEDAADNPATEQLLDVMDEYASDWNQEALAVNSFSAWLLFATAANACGDDLTRDCVVEQGFAQGTWDGGGLTARFVIDPSAGPPVACGAILAVEDGAFVLDEEMTQADEGAFRCSEDALVQVDP
jgi:Periplasmic binding protein